MIKWMNSWHDPNGSIFGPAYSKKSRIDEIDIASTLCNIHMSPPNVNITFRVFYIPYNTLLYKSFFANSSAYQYHLLLFGKNNWLEIIRIFLSLYSYLQNNITLLFQRLGNTYKNIVITFIKVERREGRFKNDLKHDDKLTTNSDVFDVELKLTSVK